MIQLIGYSLLEMRIRDADEEGGDDARIRVQAMVLLFQMLVILSQ